jgi:DNA-binding MarR family transcriptional regulator
MTLVRQPNQPPAEIAASIEAAAESLVLIWDRCLDRIRPRVSASQLRALLVVDRHQPINLGGLADELGAIPSSASRLCDRLEAAGLMRRQTSEDDRREVALTLTQAGSRMLEDLRSARRAELATVLTSMTPAARSALLAGLRGFRDAAAGRFAGEVERPA